MGRASQYDSRQELTPREREVRELLRLGLTDGEIAQQLNISKSGVGHHVSSIIAKLRVSNRYEAAYWPERPPWFAHGVMLAGIFWRRSGPVVTGSKASSAALALSGAVLTTLGALALVTALVVRVDGGQQAITPASALVEPAASSELLGFARLDDAPGAISPSPNESGLPVATPSPNEPEPPPAATATPENQLAPAEPILAVSALPAVVVSNDSPDPAPQTATPTPAPKPTPRPPYLGIMVVDCNPEQSGLQMNCQYEADASFRLQVHVTRAPEFGYAFFNVKLDWDPAGIAYIPAADPIDEALWSSCNEEEEQKRFRVALDTLSFACVPNPFPKTDRMDVGQMLEFEFRCHANGTTSVVLATVPMDGGPNSHDATHFMDIHLQPKQSITYGAQVTCGP